MDVIGQKINQQRDFYKSLLEAQSDLGEGLLVVEDARILYANEAFCKISGYGQQELYSLPSCFDLLLEQQRQLFDEHLRRRIANGLTVDHYEIAILHKDGRRVELECAAKALNVDGRTRLIVLARDLTGRKRGEEKLRQSLKALLTLYEAGQALGSSLELDEVGPTILKIVQRVSGSAAVVICLSSGAHKTFEVRHAIGPKSLWQRARSTPEAEEAREAALQTKEHQFIYLPLLGGSEPVISNPPLVGLYLPLWVKDESLGLLEMYGSKVLEERDTLLILKSLATQAASVLANARLLGADGWEMSMMSTPVPGQDLRHLPTNARSL